MLFSRVRSSTGAWLTSRVLDFLYQSRDLGSRRSKLFHRYSATQFWHSRITLAGKGMNQRATSVSSPIRLITRWPGCFSQALSMAYRWTILWTFDVVAAPVPPSFCGCSHTSPANNHRDCLAVVKLRPSCFIGVPNIYLFLVPGSSVGEWTWPQFPLFPSTRGFGNKELHDWIRLLTGTSN